MCICSGTSWGWMPDDPVSDFDWLIRMMVDVVCRDGNWLVNIGPDRNGKVSPEIVSRIKEIGDWLQIYGESIYNTRGGPIEPVDRVYGTTSSGHTIFLHITDREKFAGQKLPIAPYEVKTITTFDGVPCEFNITDGLLSIRLPENLPEDEKSLADTILRINVDRDIEHKEYERIYFTGKE